ncbi:MAG: glycosyltransferase [Bryobacteraceae bacterium]|jgi:rhamnosyl/mannosyltransferase
MELSLTDNSINDGARPALDSRRAAVPTLAAGARRLKVLHVGKFYPPHMGGIETHLQALCGELCKLADVRVTVASDNRTGSRELLDGVEVTRVPTQFTLAAAPISAGMVANIRDSGADIVHLHLPNPMAVLAYLASKHRGRLIASYHSDTVRQRFLGAAFEPFLHAALRRSSAIIAASANYQKSSPVLARYQDRCHVIPYGIAVDQFQNFDPTAVAQIRKQYGERLVLAVGRLVYYKGFEYLVRAMTQVNGNLLIVGDGPLRGKLGDLSAQLGLGKKVHFAGNVPGDLRPYYHAADIFALPSVARSEAFGIVQIEAMAAGKPVVNTQLDSGVPYVSLHERTGLTVPPADPDALAAALNRLLDQNDLRRSLGQAARARAYQEFSLEAMTSRMMALYEQVAGLNRTPS